MDINDEFTPDQVIDVSSSRMKGGHYSIYYCSLVDYHSCQLSVNFCRNSIAWYFIIKTNRDYIDYINNCVTGAYVPLTMAGNIVVDGVLASCYASCHHDVSHIGMTPVNWFPEVMQWIFGEDNGFLIYVNVLEHFGRSVFPVGLMDI